LESGTCWLILQFLPSFLGSQKGKSKKGEPKKVIAFLAVAFLFFGGSENNRVGRDSSGPRSRWAETQQTSVPFRMNGRWNVSSSGVTPSECSCTYTHTNKASLVKNLKKNTTKKKKKKKKFFITLCCPLFYPRPSLTILKLNRPHVLSSIHSCSNQCIFIKRNCESIYF
jgi:hypothetical protein